jgi:ABC-type multidrug transport system fused ATPase/permease subunit
MTIGQMTFLGVGGELIMKNIRTILLRSFTNQEISFFLERGTGYLLTKFADTDIMGMAVTDKISAFVPPFVELFYGIILLFLQSWKMTLLVISLLLITFVITTIRSKILTQKEAANYSECKAFSNKKAAEVIQGFETVRLFGKEKKENSKYGSLILKTFFVGSRKEFLESCFESIEVVLNKFIAGFKFL